MVRQSRAAFSVDTVRQRAVVRFLASKSMRLPRHSSRADVADAAITQLPVLTWFPALGHSEGPSSPKEKQFPRQRADSKSQLALDLSENLVVAIEKAVGHTKGLHARLGSH